MQITPELYAIDLNGRVYGYLYVEADRLSLIDTGIAGDYNRILAAIDHARRKPRDLKQILITHGHRDHTGNLAVLQANSRAQTLAHHLDAPVIRGDAQPGEPILVGPESLIYDQLTKDMPEAQPATVDRELQDGDEIELGSGARVIHIPGHTPGSIALHLPKERIIFTGDAVASLNRQPVLGFFNVDPAQAHQSLRRLAEIDFEIACFGHGSPLVAEASLAFRRLVDKLA